MTDYICFAFGAVGLTPRHSSNMCLPGPECMGPGPFFDNPKVDLYSGVVDFPKKETPGFKPLFGSSENGTLHGTTTAPW